jgi:Zn finger protein HypA/HybF involved in hydrogenase expression
MKAVEYTTRTGKKQFMPVIRNTASLMTMDTTGWCLACGHEVDGIEPDARKVMCEDCHQPKVYGLEELVLMNLVRTS